MQHLAGHVAGVVAGQEQEAGRDLVGLTGSAHRRVLAEIGDVLRLLSAERIERSPDRAGRHRVHANALLDQAL